MRCTNHSTPRETAYGAQGQKPAEGLLFRQEEQLHPDVTALPTTGVSNNDKELRVNVMLDLCSTNSYISDDAAKELELNGQALNLTIAGTRGAEIRTCSCSMELTVANIDRMFSSPLEAHVLDNIAGDTPAIPWSELKEKWPHLHHVPFESVSRGVKLMS